jgi:hypothetical protein
MQEQQRIQEQQKRELIKVQEQQLSMSIFHFMIFRNGLCHKYSLVC